MCSRTRITAVSDYLKEQTTRVTSLRGFRTRRNEKIRNFQNKFPSKGDKNGGTIDSIRRVAFNAQDFVCKA